MGKLFRAVFALAVVSCLLPGTLEAAGGTKVESTPTAPTMTRAEQAVEHYNNGLSLRDKAWELEKEAREADPDARERLQGKIDKQYRRAVREFRAATRKDPQMHQAWSSLGYATRKSGDYTEAVEAYDRALALAPDYSEAIEYRAEAYLGLERLDEAKQAYMKLFELDRARADELLEAMKGWVAKRTDDPGQSDPGTVSEFASWIERRDELARQTASVSQQRQRKW